MKSVLSLAVAAALLAGAARAEVVDRSAAGFEVRETTTVAAKPDHIWFVLMRPARWWDPKHTFSGDAKKLSFDPSGCFCEQLDHGAVRHMTVTYADGQTELRMFGGIGPLQFTGASGSLVVKMKPQGNDTEVTMTYDVGGYAKGGLAETFAASVDMVLGQQLQRLKKASETGKPE
jgi:hypothetical protein